MSRNTRGTSLFLAHLVALCITLSSHVAIAADDYVGRVVSVSGKVLIRSESSQTLQMTFLKPGDKLQVGAILNTGSNGSVKLLMTDKTIIDLGPSSLFKINDYQLKGTSDRKVDLSVDYGQIRASVNQKVNTDKGKFTIRTKAATMGVRGTEFVVNAGLAAKTSGPSSPPQTSVTVIKGQVAVADLKTPNAPVQVAPGMQFVKSGEGSPSVGKLDSQQLKMVRTEAFQKDMTFLQAVVIDPSSNKNDSKGERQNDSKTDSKSEGKSEGQPDSKNTEGSLAKEGNPNSEAKGDQKPEEKGEARNDPKPAPGMNQTMTAIVANVTINSGAMQPIAVSGLNFQGMMPAGTVPVQNIQIMQGLPKNLNVTFTPN